MRTRLNVALIHPLLVLLRMYLHSSTRNVTLIHIQQASVQISFRKGDTDDDHGFPQSFPNSRLRFEPWTSWTPPAIISNQSTWVLYELMCWLSVVVRSPPARRSLSWIQSTVDWCMAPREWGFDLKSNSTNYPDHGHHGDPPPHKENPHGIAGNRTRDLVNCWLMYGSSWVRFRP